MVPESNETIKKSIRQGYTQIAQGKSGCCGSSAPDKLAKAIDALKPHYREVIILTQIEGLSYKQIADKQGKSSEAVRKLVSRAMVALTDVFEDD